MYVPAYSSLWTQIPTLFLVSSGAAAKSLQLCLILCDPMDCSLPGSLVHGISQARILDQVAFTCPGYLPYPEIEPMSPALAGGFFTR